jgi:hypothetical protein
VAFNEKRARKGQILREFFRNFFQGENTAWNFENRLRSASKTVKIERGGGAERGAFAKIVGSYFGDLQRST